MEHNISNKLGKLWNLWEIPACVLLSLSLQVFLVLFASLRQRSRSTFLLILIWSAYLTADWIAAVTVGLINKVHSDPLRRHGNEDLYAFWASFLLLHLGGPDTITSFALEDNEFWLRHLFGLILQVIGAGYCFFLTLPNNNLWLPTILVFVVGSVKYAERTIALYLASFNRFGATVRDFEEPDVEGTKFDFNLASESNHMELLMVSYSLFEFFKGIIGGFLLSSKLIESSKKMFHQIRNPNVGFKLIEYELSFVYEVLHTKVSVVSSRIGFIFRLSSFCFIVGAFILFHFVVDKDEFGGFEVSLTYALLIGAVGVDTISGIKLIFSDWILVSNGFKRFRKYVPEFVLKRRRWCGSVSQYNMIDYCLDERWIWNYNLPDCVRGMVEKIKIMLFSSSKHDIEELECFIFEELTQHSRKEKLDDSFLFMSSSESDSFEYAEIVLALHLATEICYHNQTETELNDYTEERKRVRRMCKMISDYLFYLLMMKPEMLAPVLMGNWQIAFQDTFEEAKEYLMKYQISDHIKACNEFMNVEGKLKLKESSGSKSVLLKASKQGEDIKKTNWGEVSRVWIEVLCFGAVKCRPMLHAQQTSRGGELLTFTRFLMHHFGLVPGDQTEQKLSSSPRPYMYLFN